MNKHSQSSHSIIFSTCWTEKGATKEALLSALSAAGYSLEEKDLMQILRMYLRRGLLKTWRGKWGVGSSKPTKKRRPKA